jgi:hypothetical protein
MTRRTFLWTTGAAGAGWLLGCGSSDEIPPGGDYFFGSEAVGNGVAQPFVTLDDSARPAALGVRLTEAALQNLPANPAEYVLQLPPQAAGTGFTHLSLDWNPAGHPPPGIYDKAHFDVHFYLITETDRDAITGVGSDIDRAKTPPAPDAIPTDYVPTPDVVPRQGVHWIDPTGPEYNGQPFTVTYIYGFYAGSMVFGEPMVTRDFLLTRPNFSAPVKQPRVYPKPGFYPTRYGVRYNPLEKEYRITLEGLTQR